jgi:hypothetical protein
MTEFTNPAFFSQGMPTSTTRNGHIKLGLTRNANNRRSETVIYFEDGATDNFDSKFDAYLFQMNSGGAPTVFTVADHRLTINGLPRLLGQKSVPIHVQIPMAGEYTLSAHQIWYFDSTAQIFLEDAVTGALHNIKDVPQYTFTAAQGYIPNRFILHFFSGTVTQLAAATQKVQQVALFPNPTHDLLHVAISEVAQAEGKALIKVFNMVGHEFMQQEVAIKQHTANATLDLGRLAKGIYIIHITTTAGTVQRRVVVE